MNDNTTLITQKQELPSIVPQLGSNAIANVLQSKESVEALASIYIAKQMPRNMAEVASKIKTLCAFQGLAQSAFFEYSRGDSSIKGASIHLANACLSAYGNAEAGWRKIGEHIDENGRTVSDCIAFCWDKENNTRREIAFSVPHWRETRKGGYNITSDRDIYELCANMASRRMRACIWAVLPDFLRREAEDMCEKTLASCQRPMSQRIEAMVQRFAGIGVTKEMLEGLLKHKVITCKESEVIYLGNIYNAIESGNTTVDEQFNQGKEEEKKSPAPEEKKKPVFQTKEVKAEPQDDLIFDATLEK